MERTTRTTTCLVGFLIVFHCGIMVTEATIKCNCNTKTCIKDNTITCNAVYACYAEMFNGTAKYGCIQKRAHSGLCVRQGTRSEIHKDKPYLLLCCFKERCNRIQDEHLKPVPITLQERTRQKLQNGALIPDAFVPLGHISVKVLSFIAAGGLFVFLIIVACAVNMLCYDTITKEKNLHDTKTDQPVLAHSSPV